MPKNHYEALDPLLLELCCHGCEGFETENLGKRQFKAYAGLSPFEV